MRSLIVVLLLGAAANAKPLAKETNCGYQSCPTTNSDELNVHLVPHSHDDVGWLKTVDQYFYGSRNNIQRAGVRYIIDSVVHALTENPARKFIQVETLFFRDWWVQQNDAKKKATIKLVENGQLEFIGGGWSMNDEGATHYQSIIDQLSFGLEFLNSTFLKCGRPKIGWQIDPFGHSKEMANIFSQMGYDGLFFARLDWRDKGRRMETRTPEMLWQGSSNLGNNSNIFTSALFNHYSAPSGYCFDINCQDDPIIEGGSEDNFESKVNGFADFIRRQAANYPTNNIIITMGDDFQYQDALSYFKNTDKLIEGFTRFPQKYEDMKINVFYSTPSCYVKSVNVDAKSKKQAFALKTDDFFPYASDYHAYWTGYFTSRSTSKRLERQANNFLQVLKQLTAQRTNVITPNIYLLESAIGIMQHHDAITGTEKQHVADDYHRILDEAIETATGTANAMLKKVLSKDENEQFDLKLHNCLMANVSVCPYSSGDDFLVAVYNPLSRPVDYHVRLPVDDLDFEIKDPKDESLKYQISEVIDSFPGYKSSKYDLVFLAEQIPALGVNLYFVSKTSIKEYNKYNLIEDTTEKKFRLGNNVAGFNINEATGLLESIIINGSIIDIKQELMYYIGAKGDNSAFEKRASGAYIFRPSPDHAEAKSFDKPTINTYKGDVFDEVHQNFSSWAKQIIRVYKTKSLIEFDWIVGPIPIDDNEGKEVISRFYTKLDTDDIFYTDSNGKEMVKRIRSHRATYNYSNEEPVAGNYYPVTTKITLKDSDVQISVMNDRAQGGTSLKSGEMEVMLHRRLLNDDAFGVGEALIEEQFGEGSVARGSLVLTASGKDIASVEIEKDAGEEKTWAPWTLVSDITSTISQNNLAEKVNFAYSGLAGTLPPNVKILTLESSKSYKNGVLLRLEHIYEIGEHPTLSEDVTIDLGMQLFSAFNVISLQETTLDGYLPLEENKNMDWIIGGNLEEVNYKDEFDIGKNVSKITVQVQDPKDLKITLKPMQIKTFVLFCTYN